MENQFNNGQSALTILRIFDAPLNRVWEAWTNPEELKKWWGPKDFTCPHSEMDFRVGGKYLSCMKGPDGKEYWSTGIYKEIAPFEKIVAGDSFADERGNVVPASYYGMGELPLELEIEISFNELKSGKTEMILRHSGLPEGEMREMTRQGWNQSFDKLEESLKII
ncbi:MAG: hypothetical protein ACD_15C00138G0021 [uncultured bacterium]|nr:MAG: hypothetical protein ACD_15C00138G0021 [uncultured bacterium]HCU71161.1 ATPase [Candidatus Moranbacteria bacterium]